MPAHQIRLPEIECIPQVLATLQPAGNGHRLNFPQMQATFLELVEDNSVKKFRKVSYQFGLFLALERPSDSNSNVR